MAITIWETSPLGTGFSGAKLWHYEVGGESTAKDVYPTYDDAVAGTNALAQPVVLDSVGWAAVFLDGAYYLKLTDTTEATTYYTVDDFPGDHGTTDANTFPLNYIAGLGLSLDTDTDHDVLVAVGEARDAADTEDIVLASPITKRIDATWAVGDDAGGMDTGAVANTTTYYVWLIKRTDTGVVDALFSTSSSSPTMPSNYDKKRLIGAVATDGSANIKVVFDSPYAPQSDMPIPCRFLAYNSVTDQNVTGNGTNVTVGFDTEVYDDGNNYDGTNQFTAPIKGKYLLSANVSVTDFAASASQMALRLVTSNRTYRTTISPIPTTALPCTATISVVADMDANDTAVVQIQVDGMSGDDADIVGGSDLHTFFSALLLVTD